MALSQAEKQRRYRERHLGVNGTKRRMQCLLSAGAREQLGRLAHYNGYSVTKLIEQLAANAERAVLSKLSFRKSKFYRNGKLRRKAVKNAVREGSEKSGCKKVGSPGPYGLPLCCMHRRPRGRMGLI